MSAITLRPYQAAAIQALRIALAGGNKRLMCYSPTGSGKTEIGMAMIRGAMDKGKRVVFLCNRIGLVSQASKRFAMAGIAHGVIQGDEHTQHALPGDHRQHPNRGQARHAGLRSDRD